MARPHFRSTCSNRFVQRLSSRVVVCTPARSLTVHILFCFSIVSTGYAPPTHSVLPLRLLFSTCSIFTKLYYRYTASVLLRQHYPRTDLRFSNSVVECYCCTCIHTSGWSVAQTFWPYPLAPLSLLFCADLSFNGFCPMLTEAKHDASASFLPPPVKHIRVYSNLALLF